MNGGSTSNRTPPHRQLPRMLLLIHDSTLNPQLLNNSATRFGAETRSTFYVFIKESEHIGLPLRDRKIKEVVSVLRGSTDRRINFHKMRFVQAFQLIVQC